MTDTKVIDARTGNLISGSSTYGVQQLLGQSVGQNIQYVQQPVGYSSGNVTYAGQPGSYTTTTVNQPSTYTTGSYATGAREVVYANSPVQYSGSQQVQYTTGAQQLQYSNVPSSYANVNSIVGGGNVIVGGGSVSTGEVIKG
jgi:hypothetical protein